MSEYIKLVSNVQSLETNTIASFVTQLSTKLILEGKWEVAIVEVSYYKSWYNVQNDYNIKIADEKGTYFTELIDQKLKISKGFYEHETHLVNEINKSFEIMSEIMKPPKLNYNNLNKICSIEAGVSDKLKVYPEMGQEIENILGLRNRFMNKNYYDVNEDIILDVHNGKEMFLDNIYNGYHPVQLMGSYHSLYFYSNIVLPTFVGDTKAQILRIVDVSQDKKFGDLCTITYENPQYMPILGNEIDIIEIEIRDDTGKLIPFMFGRVRIDLHLRKL